MKTDLDREARVRKITLREVTGAEEARGLKEELPGWWIALGLRYLTPRKGRG